jgi:glucosamine--fructose-6-phosphate aminotransferase (isomerizing)
MTATLDRSTVTLDEILSQPECWTECLRTLERTETIRKICAQVPPDGEWLFIGCGTSYYIALSAAASFAAITGMPARAVPASEVMFYPETVLGKRHTVIPVLISRSGETTEAVKAAQYLERDRGIRTIAVTCHGDQALAQTSTFAIVLDAAREKSTVMTRSFSSMLMGLQFLAASVAGDVALLEELHQLPAQSAAMFRDLPTLARGFVSRHDLENYSFVGQGPFFGIANEAMLKVMESSCSYAQVFHSLEFRHGPKSIVSPQSLLGLYISDGAYAAEVDLLEEMKALGATTMAVTSKPSARIRAVADLLVELPAGRLECSRLAACALAGQLLGVYTGLKKGLDPDSPRNLSQVVILNQTE